MSQACNGSIWRKWDLHLHVPGTKLSNGYPRPEDPSTIDKFCQVLEGSDVQAFGLTDYYSADRIHKVRKRHKELFPQSSKLLLINVEVRLDVDVSAEGKNVNLHFIFNPSLPPEKVDRFLGSLKISRRSGISGPQLSCSELTEADDFASATVGLDAIRNAMRDVFGEDVYSGDNRRRNLLVIASAKNDGIRARGGQAGAARRAAQSDEIDKFCDGFFGNEGNVEWFLSTDRYEASEVSIPKPVLDGCDAHDFTQLERRLGRHSKTGGNHSNILWIKSDLTYNGLLQIFLEPDTRVFLGSTQPDHKPGYKVIDSVEFSDTANFPKKIRLNPNLNSIIGSRSSGKSSLLAHIAYAVDPDRALDAQMRANPHLDPAKLGPAAGITWQSAANAGCRVNWGSSESGTGRVIYIPQNSLYSLSEKPEEITERIAPALAVARPDLGIQYKNLLADERIFREEVAASVSRWFSLKTKHVQLTEQISALGSKDAVTAELEKVDARIAECAGGAEITDSELEQIAGYRNQLRILEDSLRAAEDECNRLQDILGTRLDDEHALSPKGFNVDVKIDPGLETAGAEFATTARPVIDFYENEISEYLSGLARTRLDFLLGKMVAIRQELATTEEVSAPLLAKEVAIEAIGSLRSDADKLSSELDRIDSLATEVRGNADEIKAVADAIQSCIARVNKEITTFVRNVEAASVEIEQMMLSADAQIDEQSIRDAMAGMHGASVNSYVRGRGDLFDVARAQADPLDFLEELFSGRIRLTGSTTKEELANRVLSVVPEVRFKATLEGDSIGGFEPSSMTPGKQALFALSLTLGSDQDGWPLLLDQPEDDLDSRSIFGTIARYLIDQKKKRQIIMVTHNANLAIGADSEQILVANRHGTDHPNQDGRRFSYLGGSLEHERNPNPGAAFALDRLDVPSHACEILDGGEEAFKKRSQRYLI
ncbi:TrlF family AAA-like ATPase [Micrococcus luteus]|uniref:TrlF family AAA-like ATPase n=1 Tax=Micrococcus luteus TaxID=1270 RepID=UPI002003EB0F|nr:hypothetical protein [Micrococcus luteus]